MFAALSRFFRGLLTPAPEDTVNKGSDQTGANPLAGSDESAQPHSSVESGVSTGSSVSARYEASSDAAASNQLHDHLKASTPVTDLDSPRSQATDTADQVVPFDETLLERCRALWQQGDWEGIKFLDRETVQHHPDRAKLALLAAAAHQQTGSPDDARIWLRLARDWGCSKQLISQIMISGVYNTLARASAALGQMDRAQLHFEDSMRCAVPKGNVAQLAQTRLTTQLPSLGLALEAPEKKADAARTDGSEKVPTVTPVE